MPRRTISDLTNEFRAVESNLVERINELEYELEERGWQKLFGSQDIEFSRDALRRIARESRIFYLKNPLIHRAVELENSYTFGQGLTIEADHPAVDEIVQTFIADEINRQEISTPRALAGLNRELKISGNLFLMFFGNGTGLIRVRSVPFDEVQEIITNPEDSREAWYYLRRSSKKGESKGILYPDWQYTPKDRPDSWDGKPIDWDHPIYHVTINRLSGQRFGCSELYPAQDWARAYNEFLSNWATITRSLARFAWKATTKGGAGGRAAIKTKLDSGVSTGSDYNPAPSAGSMWIQSDGTDLQPLKTTGATTSPADGRRLLLMVCAATGWPETFFGDAEVGTLATAKSLDRPTELSMLGRQRLWAEVLENVLGYAVEQAARYGLVAGVRGMEWTDAWGELKWNYDNDPETSEPLNTHVSIGFPDIVERNVTERVDAVVKAATLGGTMFAGTLTPKYATRQLLTALGEQSVEEVMADLFPEDEEEVAKQTEDVRREMKNFLELVKEFQNGHEQHNTS